MIVQLDSDFADIFEVKDRGFAPASRCRIARPPENS